MACPRWPDHNQIAGLVQSQNLSDFVAQILDIISVTQMTEVIKIIEILPDLRCR